MIHLDALTVLVIAGAISDWVVTVVLARAAWQRPRIPTLTERAVRSFTLAVALSLLVVLFVFGPTGTIDVPTLRALGAVAVVLVAGYPLVWLAWYWRMRRHLRP